MRPINNPVFAFNFRGFILSGRCLYTHIYIYKNIYMYIKIYTYVQERFKVQPMICFLSVRPAFEVLKICLSSTNIKNGTVEKNPHQTLIFVCLTLGVTRVVFGSAMLTMFSTSGSSAGSCCVNNI